MIFESIEENDTPIFSDILRSKCCWKSGSRRPI